MNYLATITSKRQLTIPVEVFKKYNFGKTNKVVITTDADGIKLEPLMSLIDNLSGSVVMPKRYKGLSIDKVIKRAKKDYWENK